MTQADDSGIHLNKYEWLWCRGCWLNCVTSVQCVNLFMSAILQ